jgi:glucan phosphorylase
MGQLDALIPRTRIAYFSMEIALRPEMHTYSGGLGVLAGDTARSCADLEMPVVFVTLPSRAGSLRQEIDFEGRQMDAPDPWELDGLVEPLGATIAVRIEGREVWVRPWAWIEGRTGCAMGDGQFGSHQQDALDLCDKLENVILPLYHGYRTGWILMMKEAISKIAYHFNSQRMMRRDASEAYIR